MARGDDFTAQLTEHLRFYAELGIEGVSRDAAWALRPVDRPGDRDSADDESGPAPADEAVSAAPAAPAAEPTLAPAAAAPDGAPARVVEDLEAIRREIGPDCSRCKLHGLGRRNVVFGVGNPKARLMFVGEAPGHDEDIQGVPFVGRAGQLLTKMIEAMGYSRDDVYIANVIKCRPPENRNPEDDEVDQCEPFLFRQVQAIQPRVIVALGTFAAHALLRSREPISRLRGRSFTYGAATLIPTFHPAYLLRNPDSKRQTWEDLQKAMAILAEPPSDRR